MAAALPFLRQLFSPYVTVPEPSLQRLAEQVSPVEFAPGETLYAYGAVCRDLVFLETGVVRAFYLHDAREVNLRLIGAPAIATSMASLITQAPAEEWVEAITAARGYRMPMPTEPAFSPLVERLRRVMVEQHYLALERRLRTLQWKSVAERYAYFCAHLDPLIVQQTPAYHVASYLGVAPETLSRIKNAAT
jgi:CRP-like cAMP-binding protein